MIFILDKVAVWQSIFLIWEEWKNTSSPNRLTHNFRSMMVLPWWSRVRRHRVTRACHTVLLQRWQSYCAELPTDTACHDTLDRTQNCLSEILSLTTAEYGPSSRSDFWNSLDLVVQEILLIIASPFEWKLNDDRITTTRSQTWSVTLTDRKPDRTLPSLGMTTTTSMMCPGLWTPSASDNTAFSFGYVDDMLFRPKGFKRICTLGAAQAWWQVSIIHYEISKVYGMGDQLAPATPVHQMASTRRAARQGASSHKRSRRRDGRGAKEIGGSQLRASSAGGTIISLWCLLLFLNLLRLPKYVAGRRWRRWVPPVKERRGSKRQTIASLRKPFNDQGKIWIVKRWIVKGRCHILKNPKQTKTAREWTQAPSGKGPTYLLEKRPGKRPKPPWREAAREMDPRTFEKKARERTQAPWREAVKVRESCRMEESPMPWCEEEKEWTVRYTSDGTQSPKIKRITVVGEMTKPRKKGKEESGGRGRRRSQEGRKQKRRWEGGSRGWNFGRWRKAGTKHCTKDGREREREKKESEEKKRKRKWWS